MSDTAGGGESSGVGEPDGDSDAPRQGPALPEWDILEVTSEDGVPLSAKRPRVSEEEPGPEPVAEPVDVHEGRPAQTGPLQEDPAPLETGEALHGEDAAQELPVSGGVEEERHQDGNDEHEAPVEEGETRPEGDNGSADCPGEEPR